MSPSWCRRWSHPLHTVAQAQLIAQPQLRCTASISAAAGASSTTHAAPLPT